MNLDDLHHITGIAVDAAIFAGAIAAGIKFRVYNVFGYRWRTDVTCSHAELADGSVILLADYVVNNTGRRPLKLTDVSITVHAARQSGQLIEHDESKVITARVLHAGDRTLQGIFLIEPGERTIFPLRARLDRLDEYVFVTCTFATLAQRTPTVFRSFYVRSAGPAGAAAQPQTATELRDDDDQ